MINSLKDTKVRQTAENKKNIYYNIEL